MTVDEIVRRVRDRSARLASGLPVLRPPPIGSDFSLSGVVPLPETWQSGGGARAAGATARAGVTVLLTQRTEDMPSHAGQIAFPGGRRAGRRCEAVATALRETEEEVGIERRFVDVIGAVDLYRTGTGYEITPIVGIVEPGFAIQRRSARGRRRVRGAARSFLDERNHRIDSRRGRAASGATTPCPTASATSGARPPVC